MFFKCDWIKAHQSYRFKCLFLFLLRPNFVKKCHCVIMYTLTDFNQIPFTGPAERLQNWLSPRLATKFGSKYQTLWSSLFAVLISSLQSMIQIKYHLIFYWNRIKHFQINPNRPHKLRWACFHTTILTAFINLSFNNFVDQILPNFDPPPKEVHGTFSLGQ